MGLRNEQNGHQNWPTDKDPYNSYEELRDDVKNNKTLKVFKGGNPLPEDHPLAKVDPKTGETYNTMFRAVHDLFGHLTKDNDFSENGEENRLEYASSNDESGGCSGYDYGNARPNLMVL